MDYTNEVKGANGMMKRKLRWNEQLVCRIMSRLKYDEEDWFCECRRNDILSGVSRILLGGRDAATFMSWVVEEYEDSLTELGIE